jgi:mannose-6-phosphate isomerase-like protein (cupin superfamily)
MEPVPYEAADVTEAIPGVHLAQLAAGDRMNVQYFFVEPGDTVPEHSHEHEQVGFILEGSGVFLVDDEEIFVSEGDSYVIPGSEPHKLENRTEIPLRGLDVFSPPRTDPDWAQEE